MGQGQLVKRCEGVHTRGVWSVAWSPDGTHLCSGSDDKTIAVWTAAGQLVKRCEGVHTGAVMRVAWSPDGSHLCSGSRDKTIAVWTAQATDDPNNAVR